MARNRFWDPVNKKFDEFAFIELIDELIGHKTRGIMADFGRLTNAVNAQTALIEAVHARNNSQGTRIADLEAQVSASSANGIDQSTLDSLAATIEANNAALQAAAS